MGVMGFIHRLLGRKKKLDIAVMPEEQGLILYANSSNAIECYWSEIEKVIVYKDDLFTTDTICFKIDYKKNGKAGFFIICEEDALFERVAAALQAHLPDFNSKWWEIVSKPAFARNETVVYSKNREKE